MGFNVFVKSSSLGALALIAIGCAPPPAQPPQFGVTGNSGIPNDDGEDEEDEDSMEESAGQSDDGVDSANDTTPRLDLGGGGGVDEGVIDESYGEDCGNALIGILRDFQSGHPDFEPTNVGEDPGLVAQTLGADFKPVYMGGTTGTTTGAAGFDQWFRDVSGVNMPFPIAIPLTTGEAGTYIYDSRAFFPADGVGFGNEGLPHNFHFTLEIHTEFPYTGGELFTFRGDDDVFVYVNGFLAVDLGGVHLPLSRTIDMDAIAAAYGLEVGKSYTLDFFFAERRTNLSNFRVETSIACFVPRPIG